MDFKAAKKDQHYIDNHERQVPWMEVLTIIGKAEKYMRKKGNKIEIEYKQYYILGELRKGDLYIINAKRKT
ncbi:MAG: hypothetical protein Q8L34_02465 [Candidatus Woesearchaeota archaeon]|nr:hypothetical protein [Candidatus Woesearchaeota archaeon]